MNAVTFNDPLDRIGGEVLEVFKKARVSPLVQWEDDNAHFDVRSNPHAFFPNGCPRLPFQEFRVSGKYNDFDEGAMFFKAWVQQKDKPGSGFQMLYHLEEIGRWEKIKGTFFFDVAHPEGDCGGSMLLSNSRMSAAAFDGKGRMFEYPYAAMEHFNALVAHEWLAKLAMDFHNPHLHLCKKAPTIPNGKTVTWQKAREHYVLLHKNHAANSRGANGKRVIQDSNPNRCAHSRRAHYRLLSSPRFKNRVGQRVWVKSSWVGPKEWEDRSGQIYKIVD